MEVILVLLVLLCCGGSILRVLFNAVGLVFWIAVLIALLN